MDAHRNLIMLSLRKSKHLPELGAELFLAELCLGLHALPTSVSAEQLRATALFQLPTCKTEIFVPFRLILGEFLWDV